MQVYVRNKSLDFRYIEGYEAIKGTRYEAIKGTRFQLNQDINLRINLNGSLHGY